MSRAHATIALDNHGVRIRDGGSTNGTYVNDLKVDTAYIVDGDLIKIGRSVFKLLFGDGLDSAYHEEIYRLSTIDGLTQVFGRRYFIETLERKVSRSGRHGKPLSLLMFDLDHFRQCNEEHGHSVGDAVLRQVAALALEQVGEVDVVARYGGEEFAVILPETHRVRALEVGEALRRTIAAEPIAAAGKEIAVTISVGVATHWQARGQRRCAHRARHGPPPQRQEQRPQLRDGRVGPEEQRFNAARRRGVPLGPDVEPTVR